MSDQSRTDHFPFLRNVYFFRDLPDADLHRVAGRCKEVVYETGDTVFTEGSRGDRFFIVLDGQVEVWKDTDGLPDSLLAVHGSGHLFGEMALVDDLPRSATVRVRDRARLLYLTREEFRSAIQNSPGMALSVLRALSAMIRTSNESYVCKLQERNQQLATAYEELKKTQDRLLAQERLSNLGKFSSMILHDVRNPASVIKSYAEMIQLHMDDPDKVARNAGRILQEVVRLERLTADLLDYSRGQIRINFQIVQLDNFLTRIEEAVGSRLAAKGIEFRTENSCSEPALFDEERLIRVVLNLVDNARKATPKGGVVTISTSCDAQSVRIRVQDNGEGMTREVQERVFQPFFSTSPDGGTGLGMVIVKNIVEAHEGELRVESAPQAGTTVEITLPHKG
ncbi:MAG: ATP-binding protein [Spirochaetaceae bacterium]